jgi:guanylate kinase
VQGAKKINNSIKANFIWLDIPSFEVLEKRLLARGTDSKEVIAKRVNNAR